MEVFKVKLDEEEVLDVEEEVELEIHEPELKVDVETAQVVHSE